MIIEILCVIGILAMIAWRFLSYLDGMGRLQRRLKMDQLMQAKCKALANNYVEDKYTCAKCTHIQGSRTI